MSTALHHNRRQADNARVTMPLILTDHLRDFMAVQEKIVSGESTRVVRPLFPVEGQGSSPMSPLHLKVIRIPKKTFEKLNVLWHSRLPRPGGFYVNGIFFGAEYNNYLFCVAGWSNPINIHFNGMDTLELRRFAISPEAPKNTASRVLAIMSILIKKEFPDIWKFISYQDTEVHSGTIYKATGWNAVNISKPGKSTWLNHPRPCSALQTTAPKIRWEKQIRPEPEHPNKYHYVKKPEKEQPRGLIPWDDLQTEIQVC